jgi:superfamily I DNA and/or RNA helicase
MILDVIKTDTVFKVEVENLNQTRVEVGLGFLKYDNGYSIFTNNKLFKIEIIDKSKLNEINFFFQVKNYTAIINIIESIRDSFFTMEIIFFAYPLREMYTPFYISLDEKILETAKKRKFIKYKDNVNKLAEVLKEKMSFKINDESYFLVSTSSSSENEIFEEELFKIGSNIKKIEKSKKLSDEDKEKHIEENYDTLQNIESQKKGLAFSIHGENIHLPVKKDITQSGDYRFTATKLVSFRNSIKKDSLQLIKADIEFKNGLVSERIAKDLGNIVESDDSYLKKWDEYSKLEGEMLLAKAQQVGEIKLLSFNKIGDGYDLKFESVPEDLSENDNISFVDELPSYIKDSLSWIEYMAQLEQSEKLQVKREKIETFQVSKIEHGFITIKSDKNISKLKNKKIILSIYGDKIQIERKLEARKRLLTGKSANPFLGLIIEDTENIKNYQKAKKSRRIEPLSEEINKKIFETNPPTPNQVEAIDIALNTPDIAIIQGPPGTGKTTIVTAIIERLNELSDKSEKTKGEILVTGIQHDAVENIISRLDVNGLPTPKFGKKSTSIVDMVSFENIMKWSSEISEKVKKNLPELSNHQKIIELEKYFNIYIQTPSQRFAVELLKYIIYELSTFLDKETVNKAEELLVGLKSSKLDNTKSLKNIYALRTTTLGFEDDGKNRNQDLLVSDLGQLLTKEERSILQNTGNDLEVYLKELQKLKFNLVDRLYPKAIFKAEKPNDKIIQLIDMVKKELSMGGTTKDKVSTVLANYLNELENNPFALKSLIEEYSFVFSATTGQSSHASKEKKSRDDEYVTFDTVIIDEAARVSPMDLLIVMVLAKRRIILVGDHRQLPHIVDENVIKDSELSEDDFITKSMFGYLKDRAKKLESYDGIKREITLDNQYRTHPLLGEFISNNFYDKYDERFESPLQDVKKYFPQNLKGIENVPAVWVDVKNSRECREERAWSRKCESRRVIEYLRKWILSEEGKELSFGIITFYRNQVNSIKSELDKEFSKEERNSFKNRLKIGTVDSFQGMEFDIVFLSIVRSRDIKKITDKLKDYNLFGFLISKNRLCVSMSRQKKSLIVVGDLEFFDSPRAKEDVTELHNFLQLCKTEGKVL